jgi:hypothetical protein
VDKHHAAGEPVNRLGSKSIFRKMAIVLPDSRRSPPGARRAEATALPAWLKPQLIETVGEPIRNPVTGAEHRARIQMPEGVEFRIAEAASGTTRTTGRIPLPDLESTHAQFARVHFSNKGVVD